MEDAEILRFIDDLLAMSQESESLADKVSQAYEKCSELGAVMFDWAIARKGLIDARDRLEAMALDIRRIAEHQEKILA